MSIRAFFPQEVIRMEDKAIKDKIMSCCAGGSKESCGGITYGGTPGCSRDRVDFFL